jgi:hypothetical protein
MLRIATTQLLLLCTLVGCAHQSADRPTRVAVLPLDAVGLPKKDVEGMRETIARQIAARADVPVVKSDRVDKTVRSIPACQGSEAVSSVGCAVAAGQRLAASDVVVGMVGGLSRTYVLRVKVVKVHRSAVSRSVEETVFGRPDQLDDAMGRITTRLFEAGGKPWYKRWWLWAIIAAGLGATAAVVVPLATQDNDPYENFPLPP